MRFLYAPAALAVVLLVGLAPTASAQGLTTAAIGGTVFDETGQPLPGANVIAVHEPSGSRYGAATRDDGGYDLRGLRVGGPYTVTASFIGYQPAVREGVSLTLSRTETIDFTLGDTAELGEITVQAEGVDAIVSPSRTGAATTVVEETIEALPTISRSIADFARLSPLSSGGGSSSIAGRNNRYNNIQIDGATLNDVFGLAGSGTPGGQTGTQPISLDAIETFNLEVAPYDIRQSGFTGGSINAVTKSGTNDVFGSLRVLARNQEFVGELNGAPYSNFDETLYIGTLGGPILRDKLFFFLSGELQRSDFPDGTGLAGSNAVNESDVTGDDTGLVTQIARDVYGYDAGTTDLVTNARGSNKVLAKLDWNINPRHRATLRYNVVDADDDQGVSRSQRSFDLSARRYQFRSLQNSLTAQLNSQIGAAATNEARLVYTAIRDERAVVDQPFPETEVFFGDNSVNLGIDRFSQANALDQDLLEFTNDLTLFQGDHTITLGTNNQLYLFDNLFIQDYYGSYEFRGFSDDVSADFDGDGVADTDGLSGADAFRLGLPSRYLFSYASNYRFDDAGRLLVDDDGNALRTVEDAQPLASFPALQLGFYAQDEWDVTDRLRLTGGLRLDVPLVLETPVENPLVTGTTAVRPDGSTFEIAPAFGEGFSTTETASGNLLWSPRLGLNYRADGLGGRALQLRGGTGIFSGRTPFVWISNQFSNTGADLARLDAEFSGSDFDTNGDGLISPGEAGFFPGTAVPGDQPRPDGTNALTPEATTEINLIADDFTFPQVWRTNLGLDQELGLGFTATFEGIYTKTLNDIVYRNLNIAQTGTSAYGRPIYGDRVNSNFTNALLLDNTSEGYEYSLVAQVQRRVREGLGGSLSYTYSRAENVNNGTSSRAISNWQFNENVDINNPPLGRADFEVPHRVLGYLNYNVAYGGRFSTQAGIILDTQSGEPFSWIYNGDANSDGQRFNDLIYVPDEETDIFLTSDNWPLLDAFIDSDDGLAGDRGGFATRNASRAPWQTRLDLEVSQGVETVRGQRVDFEVTLVNALNFLNDEWGRIRFVNFNNRNALNFARYVGEGDVGTIVADRVVSSDDIGKPVVSFDEAIARQELTGDGYGTSDLASRWQLRFGLKYSF